MIASALLFGKSLFFRAVKEVNNLAGGVTAYDGASTSPFGLAGSQIKELVCGRCYIIILQPGDKQLEIPEFHFANQATSSYEYRIADSCAPVEGSCSSPGYPSQGGTIMSYCMNQSVGINFNLGFGPQPTAVILNNINANV